MAAPYATSTASSRHGLEPSARHTSRHCLKVNWELEVVPRPSSRCAHRASSSPSSTSRHCLELTHPTPASSLAHSSSTPIC
ncbi:UNVERIFIED_CONTAM: hypothetical protein Sradi_5069100 [Sesamum radiatum]|uniref:Uncharacterized protein n=1 Tax=Sesamum radiatum TaxID=300843 RepID=A0AAW2M2Z2_SESRA